MSYGAKDEYGKPDKYTFKDLLNTLKNILRNSKTTPEEIKALEKTEDLRTLIYTAINSINTRPIFPS